MPLLCLLRLLPHMIFLSAHYCCPCNARLRIASRTKSLPLSDTTAFLSQTHCLLLLLVKMNSPRQLKVWTITSAVRKVRPHALQPVGGEHGRIYICHPDRSHNGEPWNGWRANKCPPLCRHWVRFMQLCRRSEGCRGRILWKQERRKNTEMLQIQYKTLEISRVQKTDKYYSTSCQWC